MITAPEVPCDMGQPLQPDDTQNCLTETKGHQESGRKHFPVNDQGAGRKRHHFRQEFR